jgi:hypothetical protein
MAYKRISDLGLTICERMNKSNQPYRFSIAPMMEWTDREEKQSVIST